MHLLDGVRSLKQWSLRRDSLCASTCLTPSEYLDAALLRTSDSVTFCCPCHCSRRFSTRPRIAPRVRPFDRSPPVTASPVAPALTTCRPVSAPCRAYSILRRAASAHRASSRAMRLVLPARIAPSRTTAPAPSPPRRTALATDLPSDARVCCRSLLTTGLASVACAPSYPTTGHACWSHALSQLAA